MSPALHRSGCREASAAQADLCGIEAVG